MAGVNSSVYVRVPFHVDDPGLLEALELRIRYDDGFVAYLNGAVVARRNAPGVRSRPVFPMPRSGNLPTASIRRGRVAASAS